MTDRRDRAARWPKGRVRLLAWLTGGATFLASGAALALAPKPAEASHVGAQRPPAAPRRVIERHVTRRIVIVDPAAPAATTTTTGGTQQPVIVYQPAPAAAPAPAPAPAPATTGGS